VAIYISSRQKQVLKILLDVLKMPLFHAMLLALLLSSLSIPMPEVLLKSTSLVGRAAIPLMGFILGAQLAAINIKFSYLKIITLAVGLRLLVSPLVAGPMLSLLAVDGLERQVALVQTSGPAALLPLMYVIRFNRSPDLLATVIMATTLLAGVTLTVLIRLVS